MFFKFQISLIALMLMLAQTAAAMTTPTDLTPDPQPHYRLLCVVSSFRMDLEFDLKKHPWAMRRDNVEIPLKTVDPMGQVYLGERHYSLPTVTDPNKAAFSIYLKARFASPESQAKDSFGEDIGAGDKQLIVVTYVVRNDLKEGFYEEARTEAQSDSLPEALWRQNRFGATSVSHNPKQLKIYSGLFYGANSPKTDQETRERFTKLYRLSDASGEYKIGDWSSINTECRIQWALKE